MSELHFEQGPIRPPDEAYSLLLRVMRNCPWNRCEFCHTYKGKKFSLRTVEKALRRIELERPGRIEKVLSDLMESFI